MQNSELILNNTPNEQVSTMPSSSTLQPLHRTLVIQFWLCAVSAIMIYVAWLGL